MVRGVQSSLDRGCWLTHTNKNKKATGYKQFQLVNINCLNTWAHDTLSTNRNSDTVWGINESVFINTSDSFAIPSGGEHATWGCLNSWVWQVGALFINGCFWILRVSLGALCVKGNKNRLATRLRARTDPKTVVSVITLQQAQTQLMHIGKRMIFRISYLITPFNQNSIYNGNKIVTSS